LTSPFEPSVQFRFGSFKSWDEEIQLPISLGNVVVDTLLVGQIVGDRSVDLLETQRREIVLNGFSGSPIPVEVHDGIERDSRAGDVLAAIPHLHVIERHR
jgi:hypothetical protein